MESTQPLPAPDFTCPDCGGSGEYASELPPYLRGAGAICGRCRGTGKRRCNVCSQVAEHCIDPDPEGGVVWLCASCMALEESCRYCLSGIPTMFRGGLACCEKCADTFRESGSRASDTLRCAAPDGCEEEVA